MSEGAALSLKDDPRFAELVRRRRRFVWTLTGLMLAVYFGFILIVAFAPGVLGTPLGPGTLVTVGIVVGVGIIVFAFLLTGLYVRRANREFDRLNHELLGKDRRA
ncbi:MAG TPA: DUF485 domain-containing protein [Alphaproteobacteria bacterium]|nr:DUF485 domain-containing protein [Alphaproteobacteria bacterium]